MDNVIQASCNLPLDSRCYRVEICVNKFYLRQIVEMALLVKKDIERSDELSAVMPLLRENNASKINLPFITTSSMPSSRSSTPTPPSTPTTSIGGTQPSFSLGGATPTGGAGSNLTSLPGGVSSLSASSKSSKAKKKRTKVLNPGQVVRKML